MKKESGSTDINQDELNKKLYNAVKDNDISLVKQYLNEGANPNYAAPHDTFYMHVLTEAILLQSYNIVKILMEAGADPNYIDLGGSAISYAASHGTTQILEYLLDYDLVKQNLNTLVPVYNPVMRAIDCLEKVKLLVEAGSKCGNELLNSAAFRGNNEVLNYLIDEQGVDINYQKRGCKNALFIAHEQNHYSTMVLLIEKGININTKHFGQTFLETLLQYVISESTKCLLKAALEAGADPKELNAQDYNFLSQLNDEWIRSFVQCNEEYYAMKHETLLVNPSIADKILQREQQKSFKDFSNREAYKLYEHQLHHLKQNVCKGSASNVLSLKDEAMWYIHDNFNIAYLSSKDLPDTLISALHNEYKYEVMGQCAEAENIA